MGLNKSNLHNTLQKHTLHITRIITMTQLYEQEAENKFMLFTQPLVKEIVRFNNFYSTQNQTMYLSLW